jgi:hypothetical protein
VLVALYGIVFDILIFFSFLGGALPFLVRSFCFAIVLRLLCYCFNYALCFALESLCDYLTFASHLLRFLFAIASRLL